MFYLVLLFLLVFGGVLTVVAVDNLSTPVHVSLLLWATPDLPIGLWIVTAFLLGALLLYIVSAISAWHERREIRKLRKRIGQLEEQIASARASIQTPFFNQPAAVPRSITRPLRVQPNTPASNVQSSLPMPNFPN
ncbi:LapA family protein [Tengunoibacter tsumagoiensis]|uniref:Lipopolysaccharide assembly protein A domain-containing protein n=1 Tax=Tengunoibacter tsumagoiensis TaxID=2014871 RepID=A0A402A320_9CHLR|nr:LapA family protein [Tengunoibacter tsumagoiensis]GCE13439.1 hypothetical protein KTT_32980 [Tengunoibacter tsumagoiensis]